MAVKVSFINEKKGEGKKEEVFRDEINVDGVYLIIF